MRANNLESRIFRVAAHRCKVKSDRHRRRENIPCLKCVHSVRQDFETKVRDTKPLRPASAEQFLEHFSI